MVRRYSPAVIALSLLLGAAFRLPLLSRLPNGLSFDEAGAGYDAYSILQTGRDQFGELLPVLPRNTARLHCLDIYMIVPFLALLGPVELAVRLPLALLGLATVVLTYLYVREDHGESTGCAAALFVAVSPWHVLLSRQGGIVNTLPACVTLALLLWVRFLRSGRSSAAAGLATGAAFYSYAPVRGLLPLLLLGLAAFHARELRRRWRGAAIACVFAGAMILPLFWHGFTEQGRERFEKVADSEAPSGLARSSVRRLVTTFGPEFLLGGAAGPETLRLPFTGLLYGLELALLVIGLVRVLLTRDRAGLLLAYWLLAGAAVVSWHRSSPSPTVSATILPAVQMLAALGAAWVVRASAQLGRVRALALVVAIAAAGTSVVRMGVDLYANYPLSAVRPWLYGFRETVAETERLRAGYDDVVVDGRNKFAYALILFYSRFDPRERQAEVGASVWHEYRRFVGPYQIGPVSELASRPGRHLVWTTRDVAFEAFPGLKPLRHFRRPNGKPNHVLLDVQAPAAPAARQ